MRRLHIFLIGLVSTVGVLVSLAAVAWYLSVTAPSYYGSSWMGQMWGRMGSMMGGGGTGSSSILWVVPVLLIAASAIAVVGVAFYLVFPELKYIRGSCDSEMTETVPSPVMNTVPARATVSPVASNVSTVPNSCDVLLKTMMPEEQKVLNVLRAHQGKYLQKYIGKEAGLNRLQTHRILARFAQRGIVTTKQLGNTNEISLSDWVQTSETQNAN